MGRQRSSRPPAENSGQRGDGPAAGSYDIDTGTAELIPDGDNPDGWLLKLNGVQSSHVDLSDPLRLDFEYMRWIVALVESQWATASFPAPARHRVLHLGGAACSMARYLVAAYPDSHNLVVEIDSRLADLVRIWFNLPRAPQLKIRAGEARAVTESLPDSSRDLIIRDVFAGPVTPKPLTTAEFTAQVHRVLAPAGVYVINCGAPPSLVVARQEAATLAAEFAHTVIIADPPMLKGRRYGNIILAGSDAPLGENPLLPRTLLGGAMPAQLWNDRQVRQFGRPAAVLTDNPRPLPRDHPSSPPIHAADPSTPAPPPAETP
ncbi:fused MFS/spermidine synthase [Paenarthrobacter sp. Z7-10]|uniref:spermidine synthase n=1 Tax=Paenarthrobacter sp. Z7-10 TaxID=2787635 RepID=UPI0022A8DE28|nr:fused MFS/spermidine synthase [Paenarthrobacter sp. Z7-10]MCZ2403361.1 fused MFS/spermidine synthase [Paenarthrobacter sp. Z7-10]